MSNAQSVIHVVDDDESFRNAVARLLRAAGCQVALYESGDHLLANPPGSGPGCILLDTRADDPDPMAKSFKFARLVKSTRARFDRYRAAVKPRHNL